MPEPIRDEVRQAFGDGFAVIWQVMAGITGIGLISSFFMKALRLHTDVDHRWGLEGERAGVSEDIAMKEALVTVDVNKPNSEDGEREPSVHAHE